LEGITVDVELKPAAESGKRPYYTRAAQALDAAHKACFKHSDRPLLGMSHGPFSGVNEALGIVAALEDALTDATAELTRLRAEVEALREAARPFAGLISAFDTDIAAFLRRDQPEAAASLSNAELAALHTPDETVLVTDGAMAFGHDEHRRQSTKVNAGHFRRLAALIPAESDHG